MSYVDGFVLAVPAKNKEAYIAVAEKARPLFKEFGAIRHAECWGDDVPAGKVTDFRRAVHATDGKAVVFSWIEWPSKEARNAGMKQIMDDPRIKGMEMPFDATRMIYGGFQPIFDA